MSYTYTLTFVRASGLCVNTTTNADDIPRDPTVYIQILLDRPINIRTERWDGSVGVRAATGVEIAAYDAAQPAAILRAKQSALRDLLSTLPSNVAVPQAVKDTFSAIGALILP